MQEGFWFVCNLARIFGFLFLINQNSLQEAKHLTSSTPQPVASPSLCGSNVFLARFVGTWNRSLINSITYFAAYRNRNCGEYFHLSLWVEREESLYQQVLITVAWTWIGLPSLPSICLNVALFFRYSSVYSSPPPPSTRSVNFTERCKLGK